LNHLHGNAALQRRPTSPTEVGAAFGADAMSIAF
jgi:hypothetical protein